MNDHAAGLTCFHTGRGSIGAGESKDATFLAAVVPKPGWIDLPAIVFPCGAVDSAA